MKARGKKKRTASGVAGAAALRERLRRTERRLREIQGRHAIVMGAINESVYDWDIARGRFWTSRSMQRLLGLPPEPLTLDAWRESIHPEDYPRFRAATVAHLKGETERFECDYRFRSGEAWHWARTHGLAMRDKRGRAIRMIGSTGDITPLKQAEERYVLATSAAVEGIYEWDLVTGSLFLTERAKAFFSISAEQITPAAWNTRVHAEDFAAYRAALIDHFKARTPHLEHEYRIADGRGGYKWVLDRGIGVRDAGGRVVKLVGALSDITRRKRGEMELRRVRDAATEALDKQVAITEVLRVMSESQMDAAPVFDMIMRHAIRLCGAAFGAVYRFDGELQHIAALHNFPSEAAEILHAMYPARPQISQASGRAILERSVQRVEDVRKYPHERIRLSLAGGWSRILSVPILREREALGAISVAWNDAGRIPDDQVELLRTFADQAAIAVENVRLFTETKEALEQQQASGEVLRVISSSIADTAPVFDKILESCQRLFAGRIVGLNLVRDDGRIHIGAYHGAHREEFERIFPLPLSAESGSGLAIVERRVVHYPDAQNGAEVPAKTRQGCTAIGIKSAIFAPVLWEGRGLGAIFVGRDHLSSFSEKEIALLKTFADQAAIAIENVRLFKETQEALEQHQALADVLGRMSGSIADTKPVFEVILDSCQRLFEGHLIGLTLAGDDGMIHLGAYKGENKERLEGIYPYPLGRDSGSGLAMLERKVVHFADVGAPGSDAPAHVLRGAQAGGFKSIVFAPLIAEGQAIGALWVARRQSGPFSDKHVQLLKTFADQAVIAIQNARLFKEIEEKSRQLEAASRHKSEFLANMSHELRTPLNAIIGFTRIVLRRSQDRLEPQQYENLEKILASGQHLLALINSILDLSKIEAGRVEVRAAEVALPSVLEQCVRTIEPLVRADSVELVKEFDGALPAMYVDEEKLRQIVINLLANAAKFTERGSVRLRARATNGSVAIAVADTGVGIPPDKLELIFQEFEQADASSTRAHGGTGLGLAIARRLARLMGGDVTAESVLGTGSTFRLTLPVRYGAAG